MKTVSRLADLIPYGIIPLTGEACSLNLRILCDLTRRGADIVSKTFGIKPEGLAEPWNRGSESNPHVASIMINHSMRDLAVFALLDGGCHTVLITDKQDFFGLGNRDQFRDDGHFDDDGNWVPKPMLIVDNSEPQPWPTSIYGKVIRSVAYPRNREGVSLGDRNVHQMSGRVV